MDIVTYALLKKNRGGGGTAGDIEYDPAEEYSEGTVGSDLTLKSQQIADINSDLSAETTRATAAETALASKDTEQDDRLKILEAFAEGKLFLTETDAAEAYRKLIKSNVIPEANKALVQNIGGKSVVWNQVVQNGNFETVTGWIANNSTIIASENKLIATASSDGSGRGTYTTGIPLIATHKYLQRAKIKTSKTTAGTWGLASSRKTYSANSNVILSLTDIFTAANTGSEGIVFYMTATEGDTFELSDVNVIDLTQWFGSTVADTITTPEDAYALGVPREYIPYNAGELISADCDAVKSEGKNLLPYPYASTTLTTNGITFTDNGDGSVTINGTATGTAYFNLSTDQKWFTTNLNPSGGHVGSIYRATTGVSFGINIGQNTVFIRVLTGTTLNNLTVFPQIEKGSIATPYSPYMTTQLNIPAGLRSAHPLRSVGDAYDYLLFKQENGALKVEHHCKIKNFNVTKFDRSWGMTDNGFAVYVITSIERTNKVICNNFLYSSYSYSNMPVMTFAGGSGTNYTWTFILPNTITSIDEANIWLVNNPITIYYEDEEIVTDVTSYFQADFKPQLPVESGGTVTFEQTETEFAIPNTISYLRKVVTV